MFLMNNRLTLKNCTVLCLTVDRGRRSGFRFACTVFRSHACANEVRPGGSLGEGMLDGGTCTMPRCGSSLGF